MKHVRIVFLVQFLGWLALTAPRAHALAHQYDDLAAWADRDAADAVQFYKEVDRAKSAPELAAVFQAAAVRQRKTTDEIIALVQIHPELRNLPTLGLDNAGLRDWKRTHPRGQEIIKRAPAEARAISLRLASSITALMKKSTSADAARIRRYMSDPQVVAALRHLNDTLQDNRRRLLKTFA